MKRSRIVDALDVYQLLEHTDDVGLDEKPAAWEEFYNVYRPRGGPGRLAPYEVLKNRIAS